MTCFYDNKFLKKIKNRKNLHFALIVSIMAIMLITNVILIVIFADKPVGSGLRNTFQTITYVITVILTLFAGLYYEIIYAPLKKYYFKIVESLIGKRELIEATVLRISNELSDKYSVKFKSLDVLEWSDIQNDYVEREIYFDANLELPLEVNQMVKLLTCGNILLGYEVK